MATKTTLEQRTKNDSFYIEEAADRYRLHGVHSNGRIYDIDWSKKLLDNGNQHTQDEWAELLQNQEFQLPSTRIYHATCSMLYQHKDDTQSGLVKKIRAKFKKDFKDYWMTTSTRIQYNQSDPDKVLHDYKIAGETSLDMTFVGPDGYVADNSFEDEMEALFDARDGAEMDAIYSWISGKKSYLWRLNSRPAQPTECAVVLGISNYGDWFDFGADGYIGDLGPARGVVVSESAAGARKRTPAKTQEQLLEEKLAEGLSRFDKYVGNINDTQYKKDKQELLQEFCRKLTLK